MQLSDLIKSADNWTKEVYARDEYDLQCSTDFSGACKFCLLGALKKLGIAESGLEYHLLAKKVREYTDKTHKYKDRNHVNKSQQLIIEGFWSIPEFNDCEVTFFEDIQNVIKLYEDSIAVGLKA